MAQTTTNTSNNTSWWDDFVAGWQRFVNSGFIKALCSLFDFFFNGHFILAAGKWVAVVGARTAVTVLFFASLWVAGESTVHPFMVQIVSHIPFVTTDTLDNLALTAFTWLPEIIVLEAILKTVFFWIDVIKAEKRVWSAVWGSIYLPLTGIFVYIAISTFMSYITTHAADTQSNTGVLLFRALMAWIYSTIEMAYPAIYKKMYHQEAETHAAAPVPATLPADIQTLISQALAEQAAKQEQSLRELAEEQRRMQERLFTTVQEVKDTQQTLQIAGPTASKDEIVNTVLDRLQTLFAEQQAAQQTRQIAAPANTVSEGSAHTQTPKQHTRKQPAQTANTEISKRSKRIDPVEVDAVVHPLLNKDKSLTHRKIAAMPAVPYTETVVYASVKRWRETQPVIDSHVSKAESEVS